MAGRAGHHRCAQCRSIRLNGQRDVPRVSPPQHVPCTKHVQRKYYAIVSASSPVFCLRGAVAGERQSSTPSVTHRRREQRLPLCAAKSCAPPKPSSGRRDTWLFLAVRGIPLPILWTRRAQCCSRFWGVVRRLPFAFPPLFRRPSLCGGQVFFFSVKGGIVSRFCLCCAACAETYVDRCAGAIVIRATFRRTRVLSFVGAPAGVGETLGSDSAEFYPECDPIDVVFRRSSPAGGIGSFERNSFPRKIEKKKKSAICRGAPAATSSISNS